jgi:hypothetical protein
MDKKILIGGLVIIVVIIAVVIIQQPAEEQPVDERQQVIDKPINEVEEYVSVEKSVEQPVERLLVKTPQIIGSANTPGLADDVFILGDYAFVADAGSGLQIIEVFE